MAGIDKRKTFQQARHGEPAHDEATKQPGKVEKEDTQDSLETSRTDEDVFNIELSEIVEDPNLVNVHQFYPQLEHQFMKSNRSFAEDQKKIIEHAIKEFVEENSTLISAPSQDEVDNGSRVVTSDRGSPMHDPESMKLVPRRSEEELLSQTTNRWGSKEGNNNADPENAQDGETGVFRTAVSEETLEEAKARQKAKASSLFQTETWGVEKPPQESVQEIINKSAQKHFEMAIKKKEDKDFQGVILWINRALNLHPNQVLYFVERAEAYIRLCDFQSAILNYKKACLLEPDNNVYFTRLSFLYYLQGQTLFDLRLYSEALESFSRAAEMKPDNVGYHIRSITCLAALQRHGECLALVNKRLETENDNPDLYIMRARLHEMFRNTTLCYYDVKDALALSEEHTEGKLIMLKLEERAQENKRQAVQLNLMGKHREALQKISIAIETNPSVADFHVLRGTLHRKLGDFNAAIDDFLLALDKCDHNEESPVYIDSQRQLLLTYNDFAVECFTKGFFEEAVILLNKAIKGEKQEKGLYINRGDCFFRQGDLNFALQDYHQALDLDEKDQSIKSRISLIHNELGVTANQEKNYVEAENKFTLAIEFNPKIGQYYISRARARYLLENAQGARQDLLIGMLLDPTNEDILSIMSRLFPGKSVSDVVNSRMADNARVAIQLIYAPPKDPSEVGSDSEGPEDEVSQRAIEDVNSEVSDTKSEEVEVPVWRPGGYIPTFRACVEEHEFDFKLVLGKRQVPIYDLAFIIPL
ncbi:hypothetical protein CHS0354_013583 [Potamilus streckersoni]|uniref:Uncharacterized protein n=1 Tax=Potamilus streckersoni TaxID=2493646 RepID=A0AAE0VXG7_9BIVA|nr:hypothetical protein CHS0354_013583 [Potamilus streckersoni]